MPDPLNLPESDDAAFLRRATEYLDGAPPSPADLRQLNDELQRDPHKQELFVRLCMVRAALQRVGLADQAALRESTRVADASALYNAMILPALHESVRVEPEIEGTIFTPASAMRIGPAGRAGPSRWRIAAVATVALAAAAAVVIVPMLRVPPATPTKVADLHPPTPPRPTVVPASAPAIVRPPAVMSAVAAGEFRGPGEFAPGDALPVGQDVDLSAGVAEITFDTGVVVVASAPVRLRVDGRNGMALAAGSVAAHVPPSGVGFSIVSPELTVVDRGTDFGIRTGKDTGSVLDVFKGIVDATVIDAVPAATTAPAVARSVRVTAGNAVAHAVGDGPVPRTVAFAPGAFLRSIDAYRVPIALHGTGAGVAFGAADPFWTCTSGADKPAATTRPAYAVALDLARYVHTTPASKWIATAGAPASSPEGKYTFRTNVALPEFTPGSLALSADWAADDWILDIQVNGASTAEANRAVIRDGSRLQPRTWKLDAAPWHAGDNTVDVVVWNRTGSPRGRNQIALKLSWTASASPVVHRLTASADAPPPADT